MNFNLLLRSAIAFLGAVFIVLSIPEEAEARAPAMQLTPEIQASMQKINGFMNSYQTLKCDFAQVSPKGTLTQGVLYIDKPGKLRFDYVNNPLLIIADGRWLTIEDRTRKRGDQFPLASTPLRLVVNSHVDLLAETDVIAYDRRDGLVSVSLQDKKDGLGSGGFITLMFDEKLNQLVQWTIVDDKGRHTQVQLSHPEFGPRLEAKLFEVGDINKN